MPRPGRFCWASGHRSESRASDSIRRGGCGLSSGGSSSDGSGRRFRSELYAVKALHHPLAVDVGEVVLHAALDRRHPILEEATDSTLACAREIALKRGAARVLQRDCVAVVRPDRLGQFVELLSGREGEWLLCVDRRAAGFCLRVGDKLELAQLPHQHPEGEDALRDVGPVEAVDAVDAEHACLHQRLLALHRRRWEGEEAYALELLPTRLHELGKVAEGEFAAERVEVEGNEAVPVVRHAREGHGERLVQSLADEFLMGRVFALNQ
mmetsp:Transcript_48503/g.115108  ORF Transcript_48503/g.115108 Transcript_48503/m.115108 type:complete len:267 (+) Transcript_48503:203-1003(+)